MDDLQRQISHPLITKNKKSLSKSALGYNESNSTLGSKRSVSFDNQVLHILISSYRWEEAHGFLLTNDSNANKAPPSSVREKRSGDLPLHMSLKRSAPEYFILELIEQYNIAVHETGLNDNSYPLHLAVIYCAPPKIILTLIRRFPDALDIVDNDGDTPRLCIRKGLDPTARNALMMPSYYWTTLFAKSKEEDNSSSELLHEKDEEISSLKQNLSLAEETLTQVKKSEEQLLKKVTELEHRVRRMELNAFDSRKPGSLNSRLKKLSEQVIRIEEVTVSSAGSISVL